MNEFRRASNEFRSQIESEINSLDTHKPQILPAIRDIKEPLGSLASRILNPPAPAEPAKGEETPAASPAPTAVEAGLAPSSAVPSKAAPDA
jgi:hypothetical protein